MTPIKPSENDDLGNPLNPDTNEFLIFRGDTVEGRTLQYTSNDGICSGSGSTLFSITGDVVVAGEFQTLGWGRVGFPEPPPPRQDSSGLLNPTPIATVLEFVLPTGEIQPGHWYMDDTAGPWCLWRDSGEDGAPSPYMRAEEPRCKVDIVIAPIPVCDIQLNQTSFVDGDTVTADVLRFANLSDSPVALEVKIWLELQGVPPVSAANIGSDGSYVFPAGTDVDIGPLTLGLVTTAWARGDFEFSCRMLDPTTGELLAEDRNFFEIQATTYGVGDIGPAGGIVFYVTNGGAHGLEASPVDQGVAEWGCTGTPITGADGTVIYTGAQNTADIMAGCATPDIVARLADAYTLNGFDDWFLPSKNELNELYLNRVVVGGFASNGYWSSSEINNNVAWLQYFNNGLQIVSSKNFTFGVRAVRVF